MSCCAASATTTTARTAPSRRRPSSPSCSSPTSRRCWPTGSTPRAQRHRRSRRGRPRRSPRRTRRSSAGRPSTSGSSAMLATPGVRIVTIVGPGGIGKSRLAIDVAETVAATGREVAFATLESVTSPDRVISVIARAVGVRETGDEPLESKLRHGAHRTRPAAGDRQHGAPARCDPRPGEPDHPAAAAAAARDEPVAPARAGGADVRARPARGARARRDVAGCRRLQRRRALRRPRHGDQPGVPPDR